MGKEKIFNYGREVEVFDKEKEFFIVKENNEFVLTRLYKINNESYLLPKGRVENKAEAEKMMIDLREN